MPLSEHEQRLLEQMEKALYAEDPKFATSLRSTGAGGAHRGRAVLGVLGFLGGMGLILAGVATAVIALGVVGFVIMFAGAVLVYSAFSGGAGAAPAAEGEQTAAPQAPKQTGPGFMGKMEDRWRRRAEGDPQ
ncbi:MAG: DUF3040 domain-containing protein [Actinobacteria bacterium]|nr:DUF3040 domain-containing protein [Actinomycetota bacterium]